MQKEEIEEALNKFDSEMRQDYRKGESEEAQVAEIRAARGRASTFRAEEIEMAAP